MEGIGPSDLLLDHLRGRVAWISDLISETKGLIPGRVTNNNTLFLNNNYIHILFVKLNHYVNT